MTEKTFQNNKKLLPELDKEVFGSAIFLFLLMAAAVVWQPESIRLVVTDWLQWITHQWGWVLLLFGVFCVVFLFRLAFSRFGSIRLGATDSVPEFSDASWVSMLFCAGIGISIVNWAFVEPIALMHASPLGLEPGSKTSAEYAAMYSQFHWGIIPWSIYTIATIPVAYSLYVLKEPYLRLSTAARPVLGQWVERWPGKLIDLVVIFSIVGGVGTSLGLSIPLLTALIANILGLQESFSLQLIILFAWTLLFSFSVYKGLSKGIKVLSDINIALAFLLLVFVLLAGPSIFILKLWVNSVGLYLDNFARVSLWTDPFSQTTFTQDWTVFYWAWWIAYTPMMALFVARISGGRTIREVILNQILWGSAGCMCFFAIWGGYALYLETEGQLAISAVLEAQGLPQSVIAVLDTLPGGNLLKSAFALLCFIFLATTLDSAAYTLASVSTKNLTGQQEPAVWNRLVWALIVAAVGVLLLIIGGLEIVQASTLVFALPMVLVLLLLCWSLNLSLKKNERNRPKKL